MFEFSKLEAAISYINWSLDKKHVFSAVVVIEVSWFLSFLSPLFAEFAVF